MWLIDWLNDPVSAVWIPVAQVAGLLASVPICYWIHRRVKA